MMGGNGLKREREETHCRTSKALRRQLLLKRSGGGRGKVLGKASLIGLTRYGQSVVKRLT